MTGPEHYRVAEQLLATVERHPESSDAPVLATAQVHATLALAAAMALCHPGDDQTRPEDANAWVAVAGVPEEVSAR
jgi:hypothetical protein